LLLEAAYVDYKAIYLSKSDMQASKHLFPLGRVPVLEHEGATIAQSASIVRYIAGRVGFMGREESVTPTRLAAFDMMFESVQELFADKWFNPKLLVGDHMEDRRQSVRDGSNPILSFSEFSNRGTVRVFRQEFTLEGAICSHACSLEALACV